MPLETATFISQLVAANPTSTDLASQGDDHIRLLKQVLKSTFPSLEGAVNKTAYQMNNPVPIGVITAWYGTVASIPDGWALCNGQTIARSDGAGDIVTPDLRGRFIAGATSAVGAIAGEATTETSPAGSHSHGGVTGSSGAHSHTLSVGSAGAHTHGSVTSLAGGHSHTISVSAGGNHNHGGDTGAGGNHNHGGSTSSHALTTSQIPEHYHFVAHAEEVTDSNNLVTTRALATRYDGGNDSTYSLGRASVAEGTVGRSSSTGGGSGHSHAISASGSHTHAIGNSGDHTHAASSSAVASHQHGISSDGAHTHTGTAATAGAHDHTIAAAGQHTHTVSVLPPHMVLAYIMKV